MKFSTLMGVAMLVMVAGVGCGPVVIGNTGGGEGNANSASGATGGGSGTGEGSGHGGSGEQCTLSTPKEAFGIVGCALPTGGADTTASIDGVFEPVAKGYRIVGTTGTVEVSGPIPAIPAGTFIHLEYFCSMSTADRYFVALKNLPTLEGKTNPIEQGDRLWFAGLTRYYAIDSRFDLWEMPDDALPFTIRLTTNCSVGETLWAGALNVQSAGSSTSIGPGKEEEITVPSGPGAGNYRILNDGLHATVREVDVEINGGFIVSRAD